MGITMKVSDIPSGPPKPDLFRETSGHYAHLIMPTDGARTYCHLGTTYGAQWSSDVGSPFGQRVFPVCPRCRRAKFQAEMATSNGATCTLGQAITAVIDQLLVGATVTVPYFVRTAAALRGVPDDGAMFALIQYRAGNPDPTYSLGESESGLRTITRLR